MRHVKTVHTAVRRYKCEYCDSSFKVHINTIVLMAFHKHITRELTVKNLDFSQNLIRTPSGISSEFPKRFGGAGDLVVLHEFLKV